MDWKENHKSSSFRFLKFSYATLSLDNPNKPSGVFTVDMTSLTNDDLTGEWKQKLEGHLKSDDFFSIEKFPEATLVIKKVNSQNNNSYQLRGDLTIKDITHPVDFSLIVYKDRVESKLTFDRSKYNIQFASRSFFENLGDNLILDEITLDITLQKIMIYKKQDRPMCGCGNTQNPNGYCDGSHTKN